MENPNDFSTNTQPADDSSARPPQPDWFTVPTASPPTPEPSHKNVFRLVIFIAIGLAVLGLIGFLLLRAVTPVAKTCLTNDDYAALSGSTTTDKVDATVGQYTYASEFTATNTLPPANDTKDFIATLSKFYAERSKEASIILTVSSDYSSMSKDSKELANQRISTLTKQLVAGGIPASSIHTKDPKDSSIDEEDAPATKTAYITVSSDSKCRS